MPNYPWLAQRTLDVSDIQDKLRTLKLVGVPYTDAMIANAKADIEAQTNPDGKGVKDLQARYPKTKVAKFDGKPGRVTELDAVIAYLQVLGTMVDFASFDKEATPGNGIR